MDLFLGILLLVMAVFLVVSVLMQHGKSHRLSGSIAGGAETFFGKSKGRAVDAVLSKITTIVAIIFVLVVIVMYVTQDNTGVISPTDGQNQTEGIVGTDDDTDSQAGQEEAQESEDGNTEQNENSSDEGQTGGDTQTEDENQSVQEDAQNENQTGDGETGNTAE